MSVNLDNRERSARSLERTGYQVVAVTVHGSITNYEPVGIPTLEADAACFAAQNMQMREAEALFCVEPILYLLH